MAHQANKSFTEQSRQDWTRNGGNPWPSDSEIIAGCLQRIASSLEHQNKLISEQNEILKNLSPQIDVKINNNKG